MAQQSEDSLNESESGTFEIELSFGADHLRLFRVRAQSVEEAIEFVELSARRALHAQELEPEQREWYSVDGDLDAGGELTL